MLVPTLRECREGGNSDGTRWKGFSLQEGIGRKIRKWLNHAKYRISSKSFICFPLQRISPMLKIRKFLESGTGIAIT